MKTHDQKIDATIALIKLAANNRYEFTLDQSTDWVAEILAELNEHAEKGIDLSPTSLTITGEIEKKDKSDMGEYLLVEGTIEAHYSTECVRTLKPMNMDLVVPFKICFVDEALQNTEMFEDQDEVWTDNEMYQLYFFTKRTVQFRDMIHEQLFMNYEQYPILDADSKLEGISDD